MTEGMNQPLILFPWKVVLNSGRHFHKPQKVHTQFSKPQQGLEHVDR